MRDPLAPVDKDPYSLLGLHSAASSTEIDLAMDEFNEGTIGRELEAIDARDSLWKPSRRLLIDFFRYEPPDGQPAAARDLSRLFNHARAEIHEQIEHLGREIHLGAAKTTIPVIEFEVKEA